MNRSHLLLRTNPRLTGNCRIMVFRDMLHLATIPINDTLSDQRYRSNPLNPTSSYATDAYSFFNTIPANLLYQLPSIKEEYATKNSQQYPQTYNYGCRRLISKLYDEQFSSFAPLLIGDSIPDAYVIFKVPIDKQLEAKSWSPTDHIKNSTMVATFDMQQSKIGTYLRNLQFQPLFDHAPVSINYETKTVTYTGISVYKGSIVQVTESILHLFDQELPIKEFDQYITDGFYRHGLLLSNLLNLEFMFDDKSGDQFSTAVYYGLYVNYKDLEQYDPVVIERDYKEYLSSCYSYIRLGNEVQQYKKVDVPLEYSHSIEVVPGKTVGYSSMSLTLLRDIEVGYELQLYLGGKYVEAIIADTLEQLEPSDYQYQQWKNTGQLLTYYNPVGSKTDVLRRIGLAIEWVLQSLEIYQYKFYIDNDELVLYCDNRYVNPRLSLCSTLLDKVGTTLDDGYIRFSSFSMEGYSSSGTRFVAKRDQLPLLDSKVKTVHGYTTIQSVTHNISTATITDDYSLHSNDEYNSTCVVSVHGTDPILYDGRSIQLYNGVRLDFGVFDICPISDFDYDFHSMQYASGYETEYYHYYAIRSGDLIPGQKYVAYNTDVEKDLELQLSKGNNIIIKKSESTEFTAVDTTYSIIRGSAVIINAVYATDDELLSFTGFNTLNTAVQNKASGLKINSFKDNNKNEYEILQENSASTYTYLSRLIPHINKWTMADRDIRNNEYRLNMSQSFGELSFTPSFNAIDADPAKFTHEWYYLSCYPAGLTPEEVYNSTSYFDHTFDLDVYANSKRDYFTRYFTVYSRTILHKNGSSYTASVLPVKYQRRYSIIKKDTESLDTYYTLFRGCKMSFTSSNIDLDGYKFSCILNLKRTSQSSSTIEDPFSINVARNDEYKNLVIVITALIDDYKALDLDGNVNTGYLYLYVMKHLRSLDAGAVRYGLRFNLQINQQLSTYNIQYGTQNDKRKLDFTAVYGTRLGFNVGGRYSDFWDNNEKEASVLQFNIGQLKVSDFYHVDENGRYPELLGFNRRQLFFTNGSRYDLNSREILINTDTKGVLGYLDYGIKLGEVKQSQVGSINLTSGGLTTVKYVTSVNKVPVEVFNTNTLRKNGSLTGTNWIMLGGGYNHYQTLNSLLAFSNICKLFVNNSPIIQYSIVSRGRLVPTADYFNIQFIKPSQIKIANGLASQNKEVILNEMPNTVLNSVSINSSGQSVDLYRYSGDFYPKITEVGHYSAIIQLAQWKTQLQQWLITNQQWLNEVSDEEVINSYDKWINDSRLQPDSDIQASYLSLAGDLKIDNYYYNRINQEISKIPLKYPLNGLSAIDKRPLNLLSSVLSPGYYVNSSAESADYKEFQSFFGSLLTVLPTDLILSPEQSECSISGNSIKFSVLSMLQRIVLQRITASLPQSVTDEWKLQYLQYLLQSYTISAVEIWMKNSSNNDATVISERNELKLRKDGYERITQVNITNESYNYTVQLKELKGKTVAIRVLLSLV